MSFRAVFAAVFLGTALVVAAFLINRSRPPGETAQPSAAFVRAVGKCAECHIQESPAIVYEYETSRHAKQNVTCLDCHTPADGQESMEHRGFVIAKTVTAANCKNCHSTEYEQYLRSRHAAPAWAAVRGKQDFTAEQVAFSEQYHPGWVDRAANQLATLEGSAAIANGCLACHSIGKPNADGSIGACTACHARHAGSVRLARQPQTCGQCHMGPDHSQIEIYSESKHGVLFASQSDRLNLDADPKQLTTRDMFVPTCATCHMSGLDGQRVTHDTSERLSYFLFAAISDKRPGYAMRQEQMKETCEKCHTQPQIDRYYTQAEQIVAATNEKVLAAKKIMDALHAENLLSATPFDEPLEFLYFDLWHYYGRTAKHGAFMGGADFVQWHGNYELLLKMTELRHEAEALESQAVAGKSGK